MESHLSPQFRWWSASASDVGNVREGNEDAYLNDPANGLWVVADGMGGHEAGEVASQCVVDSLFKFGRHPALKLAVFDAQRRLIRANQQLWEMADGATIGSTVAALIAAPDGCACMWAGDSRVYRLRGGALQQLTKDHSESNTLVASGLLSEQEAERHPSSSILTRAVGGADELALEVVQVDLAHGDRFLICSDGLYRELSRQEMATFLR